MSKRGSKTDFIDIDQMIADVAREYDIEARGIRGNNIVDVFTFIHDFLNLNPYPWQRVALKLFYYGSVGNDNIEFDQEDYDFIDNIDNYGQGQKWLYDKIDYVKEHPGAFTELVLIIGRQAGKTTLTSWLVCYEVYKLLNRICCPSCHESSYEDPGTTCPNCQNGTLIRSPFPYYGMPDNDEIYLINTAINDEQAKAPMFAKVKKTLKSCDFFVDRISPHSETENKLYLFTDEDIKYNKIMKEKGLSGTKGSIVLMSGNANSAGLAGKTSIMVVFDEMGKYIIDGKNNGNIVYSNLEPQTSKFRNFRSDLNDQNSKSRNEGRVVNIGSPTEASGQFYNLYKTAADRHRVVMMQLPSWESNPYETREALFDQWKLEQASKGPNSQVGTNFDSEYGAQFLSVSGEKFLPDDIVDMAFRHNLIKKDSVARIYNYQMFVDFATTSDNYACMIGHTETRYSESTMAYEKCFVEDFSKVWSPDRINNITLDPEKIADEIIKMARKYPVNFVGYDQMMSEETKLKMIRAGLRMHHVSFGGVNKSKNYTFLKELLFADRIELCIDDGMLAMELKALEVKWTPRGFTISPSKTSECQSDDLADCLVGCLQLTVGLDISSLPKTKTVNMNPGRVNMPSGSIYKNIKFRY